MSLIIILITLLKRVVGVVRAVRVVIVYIPRSNKGHPPIAKTYLLAPLFLTLTFNTYKLTSKWYPLCGPLALHFKNLPFSIVLNRRIIRLAIILIIRIRIVIVVVSPITGAMF